MTDISKQVVTDICEELDGEAHSLGFESHNYADVMRSLFDRTEALEAFISKQYPGFDVDEAMTLFNVPAESRRDDFLQQFRRDDVLATEGAEARYIEDGENACPSCGGSGHKDDATPAAQGVVKPLEWEVFDVGTAWAHSPFGTYRYNFPKLTLSTQKNYVVDEFEDCEMSSLEAAKAAAQDDYERRIRSAFTTPPADTVAEAVKAEREACAKWHDDWIADLVKEHGSYDPTTGQTEFPEWVDDRLEWHEDAANAFRARGEAT